MAGENKMRKNKLCKVYCQIAVFLAIQLIANFAYALTVEAGTTGRSSCILLKFDNVTKFKKIQAEDSLSDLVLEKLMDSKRLAMKERYEIPQSMRAQLYEAEVQKLAAMQPLIEQGILGGFFESSVFKGGAAASIATAQAGQFIQTDIMNQIGRENAAEYIIHGTITNMSSDVSSDRYFVSYIGNINAQKNAVGIECELRVIRAATGEVLWCKRAVGTSTDTGVSANTIKVGTFANNTIIFNHALESAASKIVRLLFKDVEDGVIEL